jgi:hypothetical protein
MPRHTDPEEDDEDWDDPDEYDAYRDYDPDESETYPEGLYDDDGPPLVPCPHCRQGILEESEQCPHCGMYVTKEEPGGTRSRAWIVLMVLALFATALMLLG